MVPLRLRPVKGRKLFPLTGLVSAAYAWPRNGSGGSRSALSMCRNDTVLNVLAMGTSNCRRVHFLLSFDKQAAFTVFRSHYLFESRYCTPGQGHEKGRVEKGVGFGRRNFMVPLPKVASFEELNEHLLAQCLADDQRRVDRQPVPIGEAWETEKPHLRTLPAYDVECCATRLAILNPYSQVVLDTNRYSVPVEKAYRNLIIKVPPKVGKAYPFRVDVLHMDEVIASHPRCYGRKQDIFDPLHYLALLEQRPGAFPYLRRDATQLPTFGGTSNTPNRSGAGVPVGHPCMSVFWSVYRSKG